MFGRKTIRASEAKKVDTYIGPGTRIQGTVTSDGTLRVDGHVDGSVQAQGDVIIGEGGLVTAEVSGESITVAGEIRGNVIAHTRLDIASTGAVVGDVRVESLIMEDGGVLSGKCDMQNLRSSTTKALPPTDDEHCDGLKHSKKK